MRHDEKSLACLQPPDLPVHQAAVPEGLVEVPAEAVEAVEEAEVEEVTNTEVGEGAEVGREAVVGGLLRGFLA